MEKYIALDFEELLFSQKELSLFSKILLVDPISCKVLQTIKYENYPFDPEQNGTGISRKKIAQKTKLTNYKVDLSLAKLTGASLLYICHDNITREINYSLTKRGLQIYKFLVEGGFLREYK